MAIERGIDIGNDVWGCAFEIELKQTIQSEGELFGVIDEFCKKNKFKQLKDTWNRIEFKKAKKLLKNCLTYDIVFSSERISESETVEKNFRSMLSKLNTKEIKFCFSNCSGNPWELLGNGYGFNPITEQTFDIGIVIVDNEKVLFFCFMGED